MPIVVGYLNSLYEYWTIPQLRVAELFCRHITLQLSLNSLNFTSVFEALERKLRHAILPTYNPRPGTHCVKRWITIEIDEMFWWFVASSLRGGVAAKNMIESWERCMQLMKRGNPDYDFVWAVKTAPLPWLAEPVNREQFSVDWRLDQGRARHEYRHLRREVYGWSLRHEGVAVGPIRKIDTGSPQKLWKPSCALVCQKFF
ncbi:uncharacterized protein BDZ99DRAFT_25602 [Mytilinidion resinicola]|uniref:Uncharacterized protein n=1 Tax=Mytilinidion resinicola TaxID=574789 RepID=A0A6A6YK64_9PEZI|nr:uncharacterized protein BDZ99DRAFT_25602 [Mytilinidion resinicola]KAF2809266.1 hypothetical protein BDZ99DRAFT_25602 [Mytilinidion resinicola]